MERWLNKVLSSLHLVINPRNVDHGITKNHKINRKNVKKNRRDTKARVDKYPIRYYIERMKELINYNKDLLEVASKRLDLLVSATYDQNHPGQYFDAVNRQIDYINTLQERVDFLNEREKNNNK